MAYRTSEQLRRVAICTDRQLKRNGPSFDHVGAGGERGRDINAKKSPLTGGGEYSFSRTRAAGHGRHVILH